MTIFNSIAELRTSFNEVISPCDISQQEQEDITLYKTKSLIEDGLLIEIKSTIIGNSEIALLYKILAWLKSEGINCDTPHCQDNFSSKLRY